MIDSSPIFVKNHAYSAYVTTVVPISRGCVPMIRLLIKFHKINKLIPLIPPVIHQHPSHLESSLWSKVIGCAASGVGLADDKFGEASVEVQLAPPASTVISSGPLATLNQQPTSINESCFSFVLAHPAGLANEPLALPQVDLPRGPYLSPEATWARRFANGSAVAFYSDIMTPTVHTYVSTYFIYKYICM